MESVAGVAKKLPKKPGVYQFFGSDTEVLYVGKAKDLRARVSSYFRPAADLTPAKRVMVSKIVRLETIVVRSETEAVLLESTLIKKFHPKYNILLTDDKYFQYIRIGLREKYPSVTTVRRVTLDGSRYFGPYPSSHAVRQTLKLLKRLFPYKNCPNPPEVPCFDAQLGRCLGHDLGPESVERYQRVVQQLMSFLHGQTGGVMRELQRAMTQASAAHDFEGAARYRDRRQALEQVLADQAVVSTTRQSFDIIGLARQDSQAMVALLQVRHGKLVQRDNHLLQHAAEVPDPEVVQAFVAQYYSQAMDHPAVVVVPTELDDVVANALQIAWHLPTRGMKRKLLQVAQENAAESLRRERERSALADGTAHLALTELAQALHLPGLPHRIEMYDVSNVQGHHAVASMVVYEHGRPKPSAYRKFAIRNTAIPDDMHRLAEVLQRRFARHDDAGWPLPDLLILDGGQPQLSVVLRNVPGLGEHVPVIALAKEHEDIYRPGEARPMQLTPGSAELRLLQSIRDEAHRFAIGYYRQKHRHESLRSILDDIPGLGASGKKLLLDTYGTLDGIRQAAEQDLVEMLGPKRAAAVRNYLG